MLNHTTRGDPRTLRFASVLVSDVDGVYISRIIRENRQDFTHVNKRGTYCRSLEN